MFGLIFFGLVSISWAALPAAVSYFGRVDFSQSSPRYDWSGSGASFFVFNNSPDSSTIDVVLTMSASSPNFISVLLNCELLGKYEISSSQSTVRFSIDASPNATYEVNAVKVTEANQGIVYLNDLAVTGGLIVEGSQTCRNKNNIRLLFVGDSITAAYGVEGEMPCNFSPNTENILDSYATLVANDIGGEAHTIAWSGKGVVRNYGDEHTTSEDPMPMFYNRTIGEYEDPSLVWKPSNYSPDVVIVMLGANDYSTTPYPSDEDFINGLVNLLNQIKTDYPDAKVGALCSASADGNQCINIKRAADITLSTFAEIDDSVYVSYGCDYHPSIDTQRNIADAVTPVVQAMLNNVL